MAGYIYTAKDITDSGYCIGIPDAGTSGIPVPVCSCEYVPDAYAEIIAAGADTAYYHGMVSLLGYHGSRG